MSTSETVCVIGCKICKSGNEVLRSEEKERGQEEVLLFTPFRD